MERRPISTAIPVRLWIFNHPFHGVSEQVDFFCAALRQNGYPVSVSNRPSARAVNVLIENFSPQSASLVAAFCKQNRKRVALIMTEHIDFLQGEIRFHGMGLRQRNDYMSPSDKMGRLFRLFTLIEHVRCFFRLGDLPELRNFSEIVPGAPVRTIPFPSIEPSERALQGESVRYDLAFTGISTEYRAALLSQLSVSHQLLVGRQLVSRRRRDAMNSAAKLVLNLPQNRNWRWISTMRVLAAMRCQRATAAIGEFERTAIAPFCITIAPSEAVGDELNDALAEYNTLFERVHGRYETFVRSAGNAKFPHEELDLWARLEL